MCPIFRILPDEKASPRAKANLMLGILQGKLDLEVLTEQEVKAISDYCLNCAMCRKECPARLDASFLSYRGKAAYASAHGISLTDLFFARLDSVLKFFSMSAYPMNRLLSNRFFRWILDKSLGIPQGRKIPRLVGFPFLNRVAWSRKYNRISRNFDRKVALFVDTYGNFFDPRLPENAIKVLEHHGIHVHIPPRQQSSGLSAIACGHEELAESTARKNIGVFVDLVRQGYKIVSLEPAAALCFQHEYRFLSKDSDAILVAENTVDLCTYLYELHQEGRLRLDFQPMSLSLAYHAPCRSLAIASSGLASPTPAQSLLQLIPGLEVRRLEHGCCGLAGTFGMKKANYPISLRLGVPFFSALRDPNLHAVATDCSACKIQMEQGSNKPVFHPIKILAHTYGLTEDFAPITE